jgi:FlaA1/EpsC-like NDP-sugar epimerase
MSKDGSGGVQVASLDDTVHSCPGPLCAVARAGTLVANGYGRRDWLLRRLLAVSDAAALALALGVAVALAGGGHGHSWQQYMLFGLITLPAWVVLFKLYGLYDRDTKRLSHSTLDDLPSLFQALLLGCLLLWCWYVVAAPAKLMFAAILAFAGLAMALVLTGRALVRAGFTRLVSPERVLVRRRKCGGGTLSFIHKREQIV